MIKTHEILIVDDSSDDQQVIVTLLKRSFSCIIHTVSTLPEAKEKILNNNFSIIVLDGMLPCITTGGKGESLIPFIKQHQKNNPVIIMVSGEKRYIDSGLEKGAHFGFKKDEIKKLVKLTGTFNLIPIRSKIIA
ncbi:MAG: response regulator [Candidatus Absconditabacterales bacterium]